MSLRWYIRLSIKLQRSDKYKNRFVLFFNKYFYTVKNTYITLHTKKKNTNSKYLNKWKQICKLPAVVI